MPLSNVTVSDHPHLQAYSKRLSLRNQQIENHPLDFCQISLCWTEIGWLAQGTSRAPNGNYDSPSIGVHRVPCGAYATRANVNATRGATAVLVMRALERDENAAQGIAQDLSKLLRQRILKEFKNKYGGKGPDSLQDGKSVTFNALLEQGKKINITIDSAAFAAWPRTAGPDRPRATRARPAPPPGAAGLPPGSRTSTGAHIHTAGPRAAGRRAGPTTVGPHPPRPATRSVRPDPR